MKLSDAAVGRLRALGHDEPFAGRFEIEREAGEGGMGVVYRARDTTSGEIVALKILRRIGPADLERFAREANALETIEPKGEAVVRFVAHGTSPDGEPWLAMEWLEGETLQRRLARGPLAITEAIAVGERLATALAAVHEHGVVHRDVKPSNVFLRGDRVAAATLLDFGVARPRDASPLTKTGDLIGTPGYMAPEQARGSTNIDSRADLFALGVLLFRCLTGRGAFEGDDEATVLSKLLTETPPPLRTLRAGVPKALEDLVSRLLMKEPAARPASARDVIEALARVPRIDSDELGLSPTIKAVATAEPDTSRLTPGTMFDRYRIEARIAAGGMGELFRAYDTKLERQVALKVLHERDASDRILREARMAAGLHHPNVVAIHDVGEHDGTPYLAMELVRGRTLRELVGAETPLDRRIGWLVDVAKALGAAHRAGLVHRDVKPENVMIDDAGNVKVLDFGIARRSRDDTPGTATVAGRVVGTPAYVAPEQIRRDVIDGRADQFAWGVTAYEVLTGKLPWPKTDDSLALLAAVLTTPAPPVPDVPAPVAAAVARAMSKAAGDRFATMEDLVAALSGSPARDSGGLGTRTKLLAIGAVIAGVVAIAIVALRGPAHETAGGEGARGAATRACRQWSAELARRQHADGAFAGEWHRDATGWDTGQELVALERASDACSNVGPATLASGLKALGTLAAADGWSGPSPKPRASAPATAWATLAFAGGAAGDASVRAGAVEARARLLEFRASDGAFAYLPHGKDADPYSTVLAAWALVAADSIEGDAARPARVASIDWIRRGFGPSPPFSFRDVAGLEELAAWVVLEARSKLHDSTPGDAALFAGIARDLVARCALDESRSACTRPVYLDGEVKLGDGGKLVTLWHPWATVTANALARDTTVELDVTLRKDLEAIARWGAVQIGASTDALAVAPEYKLAEYLLAMSLYLKAR